MFDRFIKRFCFGLVFVFACGILAEAAFLRNVPVHVDQPDGTVLSCLASGDEFYNWLHDKDGFTIVRNPATGFLVYADKVNGKLVPTEFVAGRTDVRTLEQAGVKARLLDDPKTREMRVAAAADEPIVNVPQKGTVNNLVVYIRFSDQTEFDQGFIDTTAASLISTDAGVSSLRNYFTEVSYNQLAVGSTFYPGTTPGVYSYQDANPRAYYMPHDATTNPTGYNGDAQRTTREHTLLQNAVNAISAEVPGGLNIDADADGYVDNICFVVRGEPTAWSTLLWPHKWQLHSYAVYVNSKRVWIYNLQMETTMGVGVLCHEMFHSLGSPDLYHYNSAYSDLQPVWAWDLMEWSLDPPEHMGAYMKWKYGTWIASIPEITASGTYTLHPLTSATNNCYKIASPVSATEFFIVEYRKKTGGGTFEGNLFNEGLLVYRINSAYTGNAEGPPDEVYIYRPNGTPTVDGEPWLAPLSANQARTQINDGTNPSSFLTDGSPGGLSISNVGLYGDTISFDVAINTFTVTSPNGGELWTAGESATVTWMSTGSMTTVDIQLSTNSGTNWTTLADNTANDGSETITVPVVSGANCLIKVAEGTIGAPYDLSDANFSITLPPPPITVTSPNGGENWVAGTNHAVTWTQTGLAGSATVDLYKGGVLLKNLGTADVSSGTFSWAISAGETAGSDYRIRVWQGTAWDESDADFSLIPPAAIPFAQDFTVPPSNWHQQNIGNGIGSLWAFSATNYAGGASYELRCSWASVNPGTTRLITPPLDTRGFASLRLRFKHFLDGFGSGCVLKIQTSPDGSTWTDEAWSVPTTSADIGPETIVTTLSHNLNIPTTYVGFAITGDLFQYDFWYIDDVSVSPMQNLDLLATWDGYGVYYRNSDSGAWLRMEPTPADRILAADLDGDGIGDLIGIWPNDPGIWVKYSSTSAWAMLDALKPEWMAVGDMNGDNREDLVCTWTGYGVYYRNSMTGAWVRIEPTPATQIAAGDLDGDSKGDLIGMWAADPGIWVKFSSTNSWAMVDSLKPDGIAVGDMNGDARADLICTWTAYGVYYRNSVTGNWVRIEPTPATQFTVGDLDGDSIADLIGMWAADPGIWVKASKTNSWTMVDSLKAKWLATGKMRPSEQPGGRQSPGREIRPAATLTTREPSRQLNLKPQKFEDLSSTGPSGANSEFVLDKETLKTRAMDPRWQRQMKPGPGEPGFRPRIDRSTPRRKTGPSQASSGAG